MNDFGVRGFKCMGKALFNSMGKAGRGSIQTLIRKDTVGIIHIYHIDQVVRYTICNRVMSVCQPLYQRYSRIKWYKTVRPRSISIAYSISGGIYSRRLPTKTSQSGCCSAKTFMAIVALKRILWLYRPRTSLPGASARGPLCTSERLICTSHTGYCTYARRLFHDTHSPCLASLLLPISPLPLSCLRLRYHSPRPSQSPSPAISTPRPPPPQQLLVSSPSQCHRH